MNIERTTSLSPSLPASSEARTAHPSAVGPQNTTSAQASTQVDISPEGREKANGSSASSRNEGNKSPLQEAQSFVYGTLGLDRPDEIQKNANSSYTAGKWVAAAATAGMLVSLLV